MASVLVPLLSLRPSSVSVFVYVRSLLPELDRQLGPGEMIVLGDRHVAASLPDLTSPVRVTAVPDARVARIVAHRLVVSRALGNLKPSVLYLPDGQVIGVPVRVPVVMVMHHHLNFSDPSGTFWWRRLYWKLWHDRAVRESLVRADALVAPTAAFARELEELAPVTRGKIHVIAHGVDVARFRPARAPAQEGPPERPRVLCVGNSNPYKNVVGAMRIFARACDDLPHELRVVGVDREGCDALARQAGLDASMRARVRAAGRLSPEALPAEYRAAAALLFPSRVESFGLPVIEAMASGVPVIASDLPSLREVSAGAALLAPATDEASLADALRVVLTDPAAAQVLREKGMRRAGRFSWKATARGTLSLLEAVA